MQAVYTDGASRYNFQSLMPTAFAMYGGTGLPGAYQSLGVGLVADGVYSGTTAATGTLIETVKTWGFRGGYTHNWNANWASAIYGAYAQERYGANSTAVICANMVRLLALTGNCSPNLNFGVIGFNTIWTPVKGLAFVADVNVVRLDQQFSGTITAPAVLGVSKPAAVYEMKDQTGVSMLLRARRNW